MEFNFDILPDRRSTESVKWGAYGDEMLPMWVADMDFCSPEPVIRALIERVEHGVFGYPMHPEGIKEAILSWLYKRHNWDVKAEDLIILPGVVTGFHLAAHAVTNPGDGVLVQTPTYGPFFKVANNVNLIQQEMEFDVDANGQYYVDMDKFESVISGRTRIFMLCNPQNPTGRVFTQTELEEMADICLRNNIIICSDEIHGDLIFSGNKHIPIAQLNPEISKHTITLFAPSKTFNIAGLEASVAVIQNETLRNQFEAARLGLVGWVNLLGQIAMRAAYQEGEPWLNALLTYLEINRDLVYNFVNEELKGIRMANPQGTYLAWLNCREAIIEGKPSDFFKENAKVVMNDGQWFGKGGDGYVRLNFGCPRSMLMKALNRIKEALNS